MNALTLTQKLTEKGINAEKTLRKITLMYQLIHTITDLSNEVENDFKAVGEYKMKSKFMLKGIKNQCYLFVKDLYPRLSDSEIDAMVSDLDELENLIKQWAKL